MPLHTGIGLHLDCAGGGGEAPANFIAFSSPNGIIKALVKGVGAVTFERQTRAMVEDFEGLRREVPAHCMRARGGRIEENLMPENLVTGSLSGTGTRTVEGPDHITLGGLTTATSNGYRQVFTASVDHTGQDYVATCFFKGTGDNIGKTIRLQIRTANGSTVQNRTITLTGEFVRYSTGLFTGDTSTQTVNVNICGTGDFASEVECKNIRAQRVTGQSNQNPSEYVSVGVGTGPEVLTDANAISLTNETDATTGWTASNLDVFESQSAVVDVGNYAFHAHCNDNPDGNGRLYKKIDSLLTPGKTYVAEINWRHVGTGLRWSFGFASSISQIDLLKIGDVNTDDVAFRKDVAAFVVPAGNVYFLCREANGSNNGGVYIDSITIKEADHGLFCDGVRAYAKTNPCQVDGNGVVTEDAATTPITDWRFLFEPAATNLVEDSWDLTAASWFETGTSVRALDETGINGWPNYATTLTDNDAAGFELVGDSYALTSNTALSRTIWVKKDADTSRFPMFRSNLTGGISKGLDTWLNTSTGAAQQSNDTANGEVTVQTAGDWWKVTFTHTDTGTNTTAALQVYPAAGTVIGTTSSTATGSIIVGQVDWLDDTVHEIAKAMSPILTSGGPFSRTADNLSGVFDYENFDQDEGTWSCDVWFSDTDLGAAQGIFSVKNGADSVLHELGGDGVSEDDTGSSVTDDIAITRTANQYRIVSDFETGGTLEVGVRDIERECDS